jgi:hypothetical protein
MAPVHNLEFEMTELRRLSMMVLNLLDHKVGVDTLFIGCLEQDESVPRLVIS